MLLPLVLLGLGLVEIFTRIQASQRLYLPAEGRMECFLSEKADTLSRIHLVRHIQNVGHMMHQLKEFAKRVYSLAHICIAEELYART